MKWTRAVVRAAIIVVGLAATGFGQDADELARRIQKEKDRVHPDVFTELAGLGDEAALEVLEEAAQALKKIEALQPAIEAFATFAGGVHADRARQFLARQAFRIKNKSARPVVVHTLRAFGDDALPILERVLVEHSDPACRSLACDALVARLAARGEVDALRLVLDFASVGWEPATPSLGVDAREKEADAGKREREVVCRALERCTQPELEALLVEHMLEGDTSRDWKLLLIDLLARREGEALTRALAEVFDDSDPAVAAAALAHVVRRDDAKGLGPKLRPLFRSKEPSLRRAAVVALGRLELTEPEWRDEILELSRARDPLLRMGAAEALVHVRTEPALQRLGELTRDDEWPVRSTAIEQLARLRRKDSIPLLIDRLEVEVGRMREDVYAALRVLTGLDLGRRVDPWRRFWAREGERFEVPDVAAVEKAERIAKERLAEQGRSVAATFYGAEVFSERVVFVLDVSGSMRTNAGLGVDPSGPQDPSKPSRMDVAKEELTGILRAMPDGRLFNLIFFETEVRALAKKLVKMKKAHRQKSLRFIREQYALGATALYPALELAFSDPLVDTIYLISDGAPTEGEITDIAAIREEVRRWNASRRVRIHGITIGQDSTLLRWLTSDTGGRYVRRD
ncbi:MAG: VWA domain-containing protein [bacterium]|nr:VWA domain-containing protein [bacterium]